MAYRSTKKTKIENEKENHPTNYLEFFFEFEKTSQQTTGIIWSMKLNLTVLLDNGVFAEGFDVAKCGHQLNAEHGSSLYIEADGQKFLFDLGFTDMFARNAEKLGISLKPINKVIFSHSHYDHTGGIRYLSPFSDCKQIVAHPYASFPRSDGDNFLADNISEFEFFASKEPLHLTANLMFLGEIPSLNDFEMRKSWGQVFINGKVIEDYCMDDSALIYRSSRGIVVITGCSHSGICNIVEYAKNIAKKEWETSKICAVIGGMHLLNEHRDFLDKVTNSLKNSGVIDIYPGHCTDLGARIAFAKAGLKVYEMGVGKRLIF